MRAVEGPHRDVALAIASLERQIVEELPGVVRQPGNLQRGREVQHQAVVILGGLVTSTALNLLVLPALYLRFGGGTLPPKEDEDEDG